MKNIFRFLILRYLRFFARLKLAQAPKLIIVGVTGSAGKTSTVDAIEIVLATRYRVKKTYKANSETGIPLDILGLSMDSYSFIDWVRVLLLAPVQAIAYPLSSFDYYVAELGVDKPGDMPYLMTILKPQIGVFLNVGAVHAHAFSGTGDVLLKEIAKDKSALLKALPTNGWAISNSDDSRVMDESIGLQSSLMTFGKTPADHLTPHLSLAGIISTEKGFSLSASFRGNSHTIIIPQPALGDHFAYAVGAALAVAFAASIPLADAVRALKTYKLPAGRGRLIPGKNKTLLIDSSYNASPDATKAMLQVLASYRKERKIAVLGDMRELGALSEEKHRELAREAVNVCDEIITVGQSMQAFFVPEALDTGYDPTKLHYFTSSKEVASFMQQSVIKGGEVILVKGSQNTIFLERVVRDLMLEPEKAPELLCRQEPLWEKKRSVC